MPGHSEMKTQMRAKKHFLPQEGLSGALRLWAAALTFLFPPWSGSLQAPATRHADLVFISILLSSSRAGLDKNRHSSF